MIWLLAAWLIVAGLARIVFAVQMRQVIDGKWLLWLSGLVAIALGAWFFFNTQVGAVATAWWLDTGALRARGGLRRAQARQQAGCQQHSIFDSC